MTMRMELPYLQKVEREASNVDLVRISLWCITIPFLALGWMASKIVIVLLAILRFVIAAVKVGYKEGMKSRGRG